MERAAREAPHPVTDVAAWTQDAFARLTGLPGVCRVGLALVEGGGRRLHFTASDRGGVDVAWCHVDAYDDVPLNAAVRTGEPVVGAVDDLDDRYSAFSAAQREAGHAAVAAVPIAVSGMVLGGYVLFFGDAQRFDGPQRADLVRAGCELGDALRRVRRGRVRRPVAGSDGASPEGAAVAVHEVAGDPAAVGEARRFLRRTLEGWGVRDDAVETATLCLSELVTNAVVHAEGGCVVRATLHEGVLTASVHDAGIARAEPIAHLTDPLQVHGRGLQLVEALCTRWGHAVDAGGASVWFSLEVG